MDEEQKWPIESRTRCLMLDRERRRLYVGLLENVRVFLTFERLSRVATDDGEEDDNKFRAIDPSELLQEEPEGVRENRPAEISRDTLRALMTWLDENDPSELNEFQPTPLHACDFGLTYVSVLPGHIEDAFGYEGQKRYISLHWCPREASVFVCDDLSTRLLSPATETWHQFLRHPLVTPHSKAIWNQNQYKAVDFEPRSVPIAHPELFGSERAARLMDADVETPCFIYDRAENELYIGLWSSALWFHSLVDEVLYEDLIPGDRPQKPEVPLLQWLDDQQNNPNQLFSVAAAESQRGNHERAMASIQQCLSISPDSHLYWFRYAQMLSDASRWEEAVEACDKALSLHATAPRQYVTATHMLKWKGAWLIFLKRYAEAADTFQFMLDLEAPDSGGTYSQLARCYQHMGRYREAVETRKRQLQTYEESLADALQDTEIATEDIVESERMNVSESLLELGQAQVLSGESIGAEVSFRRAINEDPKNIRARAELGALLRISAREAEGNLLLHDALDLARERHEMVSKNSPGYERRVCCDMAFVYTAMGEQELAEKMLRRAKELGWRDLVGEQTVISVAALVR